MNCTKYSEVLRYGKPMCVYCGRTEEAHNPIEPSELVKKAKEINEIAKRILEAYRMSDD